MSARPSDRDLRNRALKLDDAYDQRNLIQRPVQSNDILIDVINIYQHCRYPAEKVYCSKCNAHHHKRGYTALLGSGERMLFGSHCGQEVFGNWNVVLRRFNAESDRQWELLRLDRIDSIATPLRHGLEAWFEPMRFIAECRQDANRLGALASRLSEASNNHNGRLMIPREITMRNVDQHGNETYSQKTTEWTDHAALPGSAFFFHLNPKAAVKRASDALYKCAEHLRDTDSRPTSKLRQCRRELEEALRDLEKAAQVYAGAQDFLKPETFNTVVDWNNKFRITDRRFYVDDTGIADEEGRSALDLPAKKLPELDDSVFDLIKEYRRAD